MRFFIPLRK